MAAFLLLSSNMQAQACQDIECLDLSYLASAQIPPVAPGAISFDFDTPDPLTTAFANQVIYQIGKVLGDRAHVATPDFQLDILVDVSWNETLEDQAIPGLNMSEFTLDLTTDLSVIGQEASALLQDAGILAPEALESDALEPENLQERVALSTSDYQVKGRFQQIDGEVIEIELTIHTLHRDGSPPSEQTLILRADASDWEPVANHIADTLHTLMTDEPGISNSQILFISDRGDPNAPRRRLALTDQAGGGLTLIPEAGDDIAFATYLDNRFEIAFVDRQDGANRLIYYNTLTGRFTPLADLPDLAGAPTLERGGRYVAFSSPEIDGNSINLSAMDISLVDVETQTLTTIERKGFSDQDPSFSPDLQAIAFVSAHENGSEIALAQFLTPLDQRDRTLGQSPLDSLEVHISSLYASPSLLRQPTWAPAGGTLAFIEHGQGEDHLMIYDFESGQTQRMASGPRLKDPAWGPDAGLIVLVLASADDTQTALLRLDLKRGLSQTLPIPFSARSPSWSPADRAHTP